MLTGLLFTTSLQARLSGVFAISRSVARFPTTVEPTPEFLSTYFSTADLSEPAWLVLQLILRTQTRFRRQKWALWTSLLVRVAIVRNMRMTTSPCSLAFESTWRRLSATWQWWLKDCTAAVTTDLIKNCFATRSASTTMAQLLARMGTALQGASTYTCADMLCLKFAFMSSLKRRMKGSLLLLVCSPLSCQTLSSAAVFSALMTAAIECNTADPHALRMLEVTLMTH